MALIVQCISSIKLIQIVNICASSGLQSQTILHTKAIINVYVNIHNAEHPI